MKWDGAILGFGGVEFWKVRVYEERLNFGKKRIWEGTEREGNSAGPAFGVWELGPLCFGGKL